MVNVTNNMCMVMPLAPVIYYIYWHKGVQIITELLWVQNVEVHINDKLIISIMIVNNNFRPINVICNV